MKHVYTYVNSEVVHSQTFVYKEEVEYKCICMYIHTYILADVHICIYIFVFAMVLLLVLTKTSTALVVAMAAGVMMAAVGLVTFPKRREAP